ncbi:protein SPEAR3-like [Typha latifolia]|uniref:protein SPEAR3-like n=1 Tax=Typha latifolia TaxID=4733 RepID=UPI003C2B36AF
MVRSNFDAFCFESGRHGSSKKGKKCVLEKPRQPQRGLGVAMLEKIRLQNLMMETHLPSSQSPLFQSDSIKEDMRVDMPSAPSLAPSSITTMPFSGVHPHMMRFQENATRHFRYIGVHSSSPVRFLSMDTEELLLPHSFRGPATTLPLLPLPPQTLEDSVQKHGRQVGCSSNSTGSTSQNSDSSNSQELDLELKL